MLAALAALNATAIHAMPVDWVQIITGEIRENVGPGPNETTGTFRYEFHFNINPAKINKTLYDPPPAGDPFPIDTIAEYTPYPAYQYQFYSQLVIDLGPDSNAPEGQYATDSIPVVQMLVTDDLDGFFNCFPCDRFGVFDSVNFADRRLTLEFEDNVGMTLNTTDLLDSGDLLRSYILPDNIDLFDLSNASVTGDVGISNLDFPYAAGNLDPLIGFSAFGRVTNIGILYGVPEPATLALFLLGTIGIIGARKRRDQLS